MTAPSYQKQPGKHLSTERRLEKTAKREPESVEEAVNSQSMLEEVDSR